MEKLDVMLFISKESVTYAFVRRQVASACEHAFGGKCDINIQVIDIAENPELAEEHNIEALPTLIIGDKRFIGTPTPELFAAALGIEANDPKSPS
jgi:hypothetical protein